MHKYILFYILLSSISFGNEIWNKEIPPSYYLEDLANKQSKQQKIINNITKAGTLGIIALIAKNKDFYARLGGGLLVVGGIITVISTSKKTQATKEFEKIKKIKNYNEKEKLAYNALVSMAEESRRLKNKRKILNNKKEDDKQEYDGNNREEKIMKYFFSKLVDNKMKENIPQYGMTPQEKTLDNFLKQKKID
tara:strand:+ start:39 stop:617 length:579 start_codon:yes stop_codon:yes gene_type:complete